MNIDGFNPKNKLSHDLIQNMKLSRIFNHENLNSIISYSTLNKFIRLNESASPRYLKYFSRKASTKIRINTDSIIIKKLNLI